MKKYGVLLAILALIMASLACQTIVGGADSPVESGNVEIPAQPSNPNDPGPVTIGGELDFPMPDDAVNVVSMGDTVLNFQTKLSLDEAMNFYRDVFGKRGYVERTGLTVVSNETFSMVFDGHESGQALVVQGVKFDGGTINISITLSDI